MCTPYWVCAHRTGWWGGHIPRVVGGSYTQGGGRYTQGVYRAGIPRVCTGLVYPGCVRAIYTRMYTRVYTPGCTPWYTPPSRVHPSCTASPLPCPLPAPCTVKKPWAQKGRNPWVEGISAPQTLNSVTFGMHPRAESLRLSGCKRIKIG